MNIDICKILLDEFEKINFKTFDSYKSYLLLCEQEEFIEKMYPEIKEQLLLFFDLNTQYYTERFDEFSQFVLYFLKSFFKN